MIRRRNDWTLAQVSAMTGLAVSTLSKVENNQMSLTYDKLLQLAQGMKVDIAELFGTRAPAGSAGRGRRAVSRQGEGRAIQTRTYDDKEGVKRYITEVIASDVQFIGSGDKREGGERGGGDGGGGRNDGPPPGNDDMGFAGGSGGPDDDIPF